jgi:hypothetical protein
MLADTTLLIRICVHNAGALFDFNFTTLRPIDYRRHSLPNKSFSPRNNFKHYGGYGRVMASP